MRNTADLRWNWRNSCTAGQLPSGCSRTIPTGDLSSIKILGKDLQRTFFHWARKFKPSITSKAPFCKDENRSRLVHAYKVIPGISEESKSERLQGNNTIKFLHDNLSSQVSRPLKFNPCTTTLVLAITLPTQCRKKWGLFRAAFYNSTVVS